VVFSSCESNSRPSPKSFWTLSDRIDRVESWKEDCKCYGSFSESDLKRIEETASCAISIHSSFLTIRDKGKEIEVVDGDQESLELKSLSAKDSQTKTE